MLRDLTGIRAFPNCPNQILVEKAVNHPDAAAAVALGAAAAAAGSEQIWQCVEVGAYERAGRGRVVRVLGKWKRATGGLETIQEGDDAGW